MSNDIEIVAGTYEEFLVGYKINDTDESNDFSHTFATHAHTGSIKCVSSAGRFLASGGSDDKIVIHDMKTRTENQVLLHHNGTVHAVAFSNDGSHLFSGGSDGSLYAIRTGSWLIEKHWPKAHKGAAVTYIAIHPSNKLALTIGDDRTLRTWNLIKGRQAYATNLKSKGTANPLSVVWSPKGERFCLTGYNDISVWCVSNAALEQTLKCPSRAICAAWISETLIVAGLESGDVTVFNLESGENYSHSAHTQRIKGIAFESKYLYTASSSGQIKVWKMKIEKKKLTEKITISTDCRITCLVLVKPFESVKKEIFMPIEDVSDPHIDDIEEAVTKKEKRKISESILVMDDNDSIEDQQIPEAQAMLTPYVTVTTDDGPAKKKIKKHFNKVKNKKKIK